MLSKNVLGLIAATVLTMTALPAMAEVHFSFGTSFHDGGHRGHHGYRHERHHSYRPAFYPTWHDDFYERRHRRNRVVYIEQPVRTIVQPVYVSAPQPVNNGYCREYQRQVRVGGRIQESYGTACQQPDGAWKIASD